MEFWESGFYDKDGNKMETDAVLAALFSKINQLEKRIEDLEEENAILRKIGMFDLDKEEDIFNDIVNIKGYEWKRDNNFTIDSEDCNMPYLLYYISEYIDNQRTEEEEKYYW